jgi:hypothetical protein
MIFRRSARAYAKTAAVRCRCDVLAAERGWGVRVLDVEDVAGALVGDEGLRVADAGDEAAGLVLDVQVHGQEATAGRRRRALPASFHVSRITPIDAAKTWRARSSRASKVSAPTLFRGS